MVGITAIFLLPVCVEVLWSPIFGVDALLRYGVHSETALQSSGRTSPIAGHPTPYTPSEEELLYRLRLWSFGNDKYNAYA